MGDRKQRIKPFVCFDLGKTDADADARRVEIIKQLARKAEEDEGQDKTRGRGDREETLPRPER